MPTYRVMLYGTANASIVVETDETDPHQIVEEAMEEGMPTLCAQCSGWGQHYSLEIPEEWAPVTEEDGQPMFYEVED